MNTTHQADTPVLQRATGTTYHTWTHPVGAGIGFAEGTGFHTSGNLTPGKELLAGAARVSIRIEYRVRLLTSNVWRVHNRTQWAHQWGINIGVRYGKNSGGHEYQLLAVLSHADLIVILAKLCRKLVRLHKQNPDRFAHLAVADLPKIPRHRWFNRAVDQGRAGVFTLALDEEDANRYELFLLSSS